MPTGKTNKADAGLGPNRAKDLSFGPERMVVRLVDGRELSVPLVLYPTLRKASREQRADWDLIGGGRAIRWESLDLDLSVEGILQGFAERIPQPPSHLGRPASKTGRHAG